MAWYWTLRTIKAKACLTFMKLWACLKSLHKIIFLSTFIGGFIKESILLILTAFNCFSLFEAILSSLAALRFNLKLSDYPLSSIVFEKLSSSSLLSKFVGLISFSINLIWMLYVQWVLFIPNKDLRALIIVKSCNLMPFINLCGYLV